MNDISVDIDDTNGISVEFEDVVLGAGITGNFDDLENRPKYNNTEMTHETNIPIVRTALSEMTEDSTHRVVTDIQKAAWNAKADTDDIPTLLSQLSTDSTHRLVTDAEKASWNAKVDTDDIPTELSELNGDATHRTVSDTEKAAWNAKADTDDIPTELSELNDDATHRLVTDAEKTSWNEKADTDDIPTKTSQLTNDSGFLTQHQDISGKADKTITVNGQALNSNVLLDGDDINVDESAETKQTIKAALTAQSSQIDTLEDDIADEYDSTATYASGDYAMHDGVLKKYNGSTWSAVKLTDEMGSGSGGGVPLDENSTVEFSMGYDSGGLYIVTEEN